MKNILLVVCGLFLTQGLAFAGLLGPGQPTGKGGTFSIGPGLAVSTGELEGGNGGADYTQIQAYVQAGYAFTDKFEVYVQGGVADMEVDDSFSAEIQPFGAAGLKAHLTSIRALDIGAFAQGSVFSDYAVGNQEITGLYEGIGGIVLQGEIERSFLYGGPYYYIHEGDAKNLAGTGNTFKESGCWGGFVGVRWPLAEGIIIDLEGHLRKGFAIGADLLYTF